MLNVDKVHLSLSFLGPVKVVYGQRPLSRFRTKAVLALLVALVCERDLVHSREALMALLWPELPTKSAQGSLRHTLYHLRQMIPNLRGPGDEVIPFILADRKTIQVNPAGRIQLDITQFEAGTAAASSLADLETAVALYRDDFLTGFYLPGSPNFENWVQTRREGLRLRLLNGLARLADEQIKQANFAQAEALVRRQLDIDNLHEEAHLQLMMILARSGRRTAALSHYQSLRHLLQDELGIGPSSATEVLVDTIRDDSFSGEMRGDEQALKLDAPAQSPHNLPPQATPFIGRQSELTALDDLITDPQTRLVTIVGQGGMGKTRLSLAAAEYQLVQHSFPQGVFFVPLAGLNESERIVPAIAEAMQVQMERGEAQLLDYLRAKRILLVLDNFEHLLDGCDLVSRLLQAAPLLQILVTSRERLRLQWEQVYRIEGLSLVDMGDARALFVQAARRLHPNFQARGESLGTLDHICRLVEGMPLALELASAWVDLFTLEEIALEIQRNLDFLESDMRDMPVRHRSMQAVFETSWQQLEVKLQQVLAGLAVFRDGFTREAAASIIHASLSELAALVNKSLLSFDAHENRYHVHELLRQFSLARLTDKTVPDRHSAYYIDWFVQQLPNLSGPEYVQAKNGTDLEMNNIRAAINQAIHVGRTDDFKSVLDTFAFYYEIQNSPMDANIFYEYMRLELAADPKTSKRTLFWITARQVDILFALGHDTAAEQLWPEGQRLLADLALHQGDTRAERAFSYFIDGFRQYQKRPRQARQLLQQGYDLALEIDDRLLAAQALMASARAARNEGDLAAAEALLVDSIRLLQTLNYQIGVVACQFLQGELAGIAGRFEEAEKRLLAAIAVSRILPASDFSYGLAKLQTVYFFAGRFKEAGTLLAEEKLLHEESGYTWGLIRCHVCLGLSYLHEGRYEKAQEEGHIALRLSQQHGHLFFTCEALALLAQTQLAIGDYRLVKEYLEQSDRLCPSRPVGQQTYVAGNHLYWSMTEAALDFLPAARQHLQSELQSAVKRKDHLNMANVLAAAAYIEAVNNEAVSAVELYTLAQQHPFVANSCWFADVVEKRIKEASAVLSPDETAWAVAGGETMDMWETAGFLQGWTAELG